MNNACAAGQSCNAAAPVPTGTACGCPADGGNLGTGCGNRSVNATAADATNNVVLRCEAEGACRLWKVLTDCGAKGLTAGTTNGAATCQCKPASAGAYYVDPSPPAEPLLAGSPPTGSQSPAACRLRSVTEALGKLTDGTAFTRIVLVHDSLPVHIGVANGEVFPFNIPSGITITTADGANLDPAHYTIDVASVPASQPVILLGDAATIEGVTLDASGAGAATAGTGVTGVVTCASVTAAQTAIVKRVVIKAKAAATGLLVRGACALSTAEVGIYGATTGVDVTRTAAGTATLASLAATDLTVISTTPASIGVRVGAGLDAGARSSAVIGRAIVNVQGTGFVVAGGSLTASDALVTFAGTAASATSRGFVVSGGTASFTNGGVTVADHAGPGNAIAAEITAGSAVLAGMGLIGGAHFTGVQISNAAAVTLKGSAAGSTKATTTLTATATDTADGVVILAGASGASLTIDGNTEISRFDTGVVVNDGSFGVQGSGVAVFANRGDGIQLLGTTAGPTRLVSNAAIRDNGGIGVVVRTTIPATVQGCTVAGNGGDGIDVQRTQTTADVGTPRFALTGSTITGGAARGVALTGHGPGTGALSGGKVAARLNGNTISSNAGVGLLVAEAADNADGDDVTEVWLEDNDVGGNLTVAPVAPTLAGGVLFASSGAGTRILLRGFLGNRVHGNGRHEIGFDLAQNDGTPWKLTSDTSGGASTCAAAAKPNFVYCYDYVPGSDFGIAVAAAGIHLDVKGMHFQNVPPSGGRDHSAVIPTSEITALCSAQACQ
ncbi:MAG: right-handed parallel beta-helix repeat-containing protein [Pseudomonadota bacterium]